MNFWNHNGQSYEKNIHWFFVFVFFNLNVRYPVTPKVEKDNKLYSEEILTDFPIYQ